MADKPRGSLDEARCVPTWPGPNLQHFSAIDEKLSYFLGESFFREAWDDLVGCWGTEALPILHRLGVVVFKPEAIVSRRLQEITDFCEAHKFRPIYVSSFRMSPLVMREIWRYQWNIATTERIAVATALYNSQDTLMIFFEDQTTNSPWPGSVRLRSLKGHANPERRQPGELRTVLGGTNPMLTFVHMPDEPADIVRELAVCFSRPERLELLQALDRALRAQLPRSAVQREIDDLYRKSPSHNLSAEEALDRVRRGLLQEGKEAVGERRDCVEKLLAELEQCGPGRQLRWRVLTDGIAELGLAVDPWDLIVLGTQYIEHDVANRVALIEGDGRSGWTSGKSRVLR